MEITGKAIGAICEEFRSVLESDGLTEKLDQQTPRIGVKLAQFDIPGQGPFFSRYVFNLGYDYKRKSPRLELTVTGFSTLSEKPEEGGSFFYLRQKTAKGKIWRRAGDYVGSLGGPSQYSDEEIAELLLTHDTQPGQIKEKVVQFLEN